MNLAIEATDMDTEALIRRISEPFLSELPEVSRTVFGHVDYFRRKGLDGNNSTSLEDSLLLYLLVRYFCRRSAFESGTNVGTTAVAINDGIRRNGGAATTCDPIDYGALSPWSGIRFIHATSNVALAILEAEGHKVDFAFFDWLPDEATIATLNRVTTEDAILAVHDYMKDMKGEMAVDNFNRLYRRHHTGRWFLPTPPDPVAISDGTLVNYCTAFFIPNALLVTLAPAS